MGLSWSYQVALVHSFLVSPASVHALTFAVKRSARLLVKAETASEIMLADQSLLVDLSQLAEGLHHAHRHRRARTVPAPLV